jgi:hypothetical protein
MLDIMAAHVLPISFILIKSVSIKSVLIKLVSLINFIIVIQFFYIKKNNFINFIDLLIYIIICGYAEAAVFFLLFVNAQYFS